MKMQTRSTKVMTINGKPVMDGVASKKLVIKPDDIDHAKTKSASGCAAAVAIRRQFKVKGARVYLSRTFMEHPSVWVRYNTPASLRAEIISFDRGYRNWKGGEFTLRPPSPGQLAGAREKARKKAEAKGEPRDPSHAKIHRYTPKGVRRAGLGNKD